MLAFSIFINDIRVGRNEVLLPLCVVVLWWLRFIGNVLFNMKQLCVTYGNDNRIFF